MSGAPDLPLPDLGSLKRGRFTYFPVAPGRLEFARKYAAPSCGTARNASRWSFRPACSRPGCRRSRRLPEMSLIFYPDEAAAAIKRVYVPVEPADPFTEAIRTAVEIDAEIVFADPEVGNRPHLKDAYPDPYALRYIGFERISRPTACIRSRGPTKSRATPWGSRGSCREPIRRPLSGGDFAESARPSAGRHGRAAGQPRPCRAREGVELLNPHPESLGEICAEYPHLQWRYENFRKLMTDNALVDRRHAQLAVFRIAEKEYEANTGERIVSWQRSLLARYSRNLARAGNELTARTLRPHRGRARRRRRQLRLGSLGGRQPLSAPTDHVQPAHRAHFRRRSLDGHPPHPHSPPAAEYEAPPSARRARSRARRKKFPANGPASSTAPASVRIRRKTW